MINRDAAFILKKKTKGFPVIAVTGPRQSGKTTLVRDCFRNKPYVSLEELSEMQFANREPKRFLSQFPNGAIIDEAQRAPDLFSYIQIIVDEDKRKRSGLFILTGSQQCGLLSRITQSLAGRVFLLSLLPFSLTELQNAEQAPESIEDLLFQGLYPPIYDRRADPRSWYEAYITTYIERDVRQLINIRDLNSFQHFVQMCAISTGQLLNLSSLARDCSIDHTTARSWLSVLEASYLVYLLHPHFSNLNKRLIKSPKLYFLDTGLAARLLGLHTAKQISTHPHRGALFETWVVSEILKMRFNQGWSSNLYFWRDWSGYEVDILIEHFDRIIPIEVKSGKRLSADVFKGINHWYGMRGSKTGESYIVYGGQDQQTMHGVTAVPWQEIASLQSIIV